MSKQESIAILEVHKENPQRTTTFEEYRDAHVAYVNMLIGKLQSDILKEESIQTWLVRTEVKVEPKVEPNE